MGFIDVAARISKNGWRIPSVGVRLTAAPRDPQQDAGLRRRELVRDDVATK
ncbi:hypothetical protein AKJ09_05100 [Labilithrix luteola]|uniref:Uncharacterized protein n=1 Tax=Labilithrix luteola TaxID=1391654 RepID=A0A0K1PYH4_9BACT|nr:hypothetical protein AKJ09_05100 [Labilithrix luteola]